MDLTSPGGARESQAENPHLPVLGNIVQEHIRAVDELVLHLNVGGAAIHKHFRVEHEREGLFVIRLGCAQGQVRHVPGRREAALYIAERLAARGIRLQRLHREVVSESEETDCEGEEDPLLSMRGPNFIFHVGRRYQFRFSVIERAGRDWVIQIMGQRRAILTMPRGMESAVSRDDVYEVSAHCLRNGTSSLESAFAVYDASALPITLFTEAT